MHPAQASVGLATKLSVSRFWTKVILPDEFDNFRDNGFLAITVRQRHYPINGELICTELLNTQMAKRPSKHNLATHHAKTTNANLTTIARRC